MLLEDRFGPLPQALVEQIDTTEELERLRGAIRQVGKLTALDDLNL